ncbi:hypothetical protein [Streptomyces sp. HUCO-GS316]|uniref:hypothetical protein n=1 Tax=Streptomyces sp. HUCO-GS316 TaxID=2692198 RepID=UPI00301E59E0
MVFVDPAYTSQQCCECRHTDKKNERFPQHRPQGRRCVDCGARVTRPCHPSRVSGRRNPAASWALPPSPVLQDRVKLTATLPIDAVRRPR